MKNWEDKTTVKKGDFAEDIVHKFLEDKGYIVYVPKTKGAHAFDRMAIKNKEQAIIAEIKAKAKLNNYDETGFEYRHYLDYKKISTKHNLPVFIFFVDEMLKEIYGNFLSKLEQDCRRSPWNGGSQILFQMKLMHRNIYNLTDSDVAYLKQNSTRTHAYNNS